MKPVTSATGDTFRGKAAHRHPHPVGNFPAGPEISARRVLVVDDEPLIRWSVVESLCDDGLNVEEAPDASTALRMITTAAKPFDVIVLDLRLPDMHDLSLLGTLRQLLPGAMLILMTAFGTPEIIAEAEGLGAAVISKPFELDALKQLING